MFFGVLEEECVRIIRHGEIASFGKRITNGLALEIFSLLFVDFAEVNTVLEMDLFSVPIELDKSCGGC